MVAVLEVMDVALADLEMGHPVAAEKVQAAVGTAVRKAVETVEMAGSGKAADQTHRHQRTGSSDPKTTS